MSTTAYSLHAEALADRMRRQFPAWRELRLAGGTPATTTFPGEPLRTRAMIALNPDFTQEYTTWNWVDITRDLETDSSIVRWEQQISILTGGRPSAASIVDPSTCKFRATNDKRFSRRNPLSPYYGQLSEYTPVWIQLDYGQGWKDRYFGFIHDFSKAWDTSGNDSYIDLTARGPLYRAGKSKPLKSAVYRAISGVAEGDYRPHGFWSGEDAAGSAQIGSALPNQPAVVPSGPVTFGAVGPAGASAVFTPGDGFTATFPVVSYDDTGRWAITFIMKVDTSPTAISTLLTVHTVGGTLPTWKLIFDPDSFGGFDQIRWNGYDAAGVLQYNMEVIVDGDPSFSPGTEAEFYGSWRMWTVGAYNRNTNQVGSTVTIDDGSDHRMRLVNGNILVGTVGALNDFAFTVDTTMSTAVVNMGAIGVFIDPGFAPFEAAAALANGEALHGYNAEPSITRMRRVTREERIPFFSLAIEEDSALCGPQLPGNLVDVLRVPEIADGGTLYEYKFGLAYKSLMEYQNQSVGLTLDAALSQVLSIGSPVDNDLDFVNQWTVSRPSGSSATVQGRKGEAGVTLGDNELVYENSKTVSLAYDSQLTDYASRLVQVTTVDEDRWPTIAFTMAGHPELIDSWIEFAFGGRINALNVYEEVGVRTLDQTHRGHSEAWNSTKWEVVLNCTPTSVFNTLEVESDDFGRVDSDSSTLALDITDSDTSMLVETRDDAELWITTANEPNDFPLDLKLYQGTGEAISSGGETLTVSGISDAISDTFTRAAADWGNTDTGETWVVQVGTAANFTTTGTVGRMALSTLNAEHIITVDLGYAAHQKVKVSNLLNVTPTGAPINWGAILRCANQNNLYWIDVQVQTTGVLTLRVISKKNGTNVAEATATSATPHSTSVARILVAEITPDNLIRCKVYASGSIEPSWELNFQDTSGSLLTGTSVGCISRLMTGNTNVTPVNLDFDNFAVLNPQTFTIDSRSNNGIVKAHKAGTVVRTDPMTVFG